MNLPEDYGDEEERKRTDSRLLPPELDDPALSHDSHGQSCRSVLEDIRKEHKTLKPRMSHNTVRGRTDQGRARIMRRRKVEGVSIRPGRE